jgi:hypothetical protein
MTLPSERTRAVQNTRDFLLDLLDPKKTPRIPREIRRRASALLRHYPSRLDMEETVEEGSSRFGADENNPLRGQAHA